MTTQEAWEKQREIIEDIKKREPELIEPKKARSEAEIFKEIGIGNMPINRQRGYLRLHYQDFLVEELTQDKKIIRVNEINNEIKEARDEKERTLYTHLIKIGIHTNTAIDRLNERLNFTGKIGYAGLKDEEAISAQLVAFPRIKLSVDEIKKIKIANILLTNFYYGKGNLRPGYLKGNYFTITIRTEKGVNEAELKLRLANLEKFGFLNYFQSQRFGGIRLISHKIGKLIFQGNYELAIRYLLFKTNEYEMPLIAKLKKQAEKIHPDYDAIIKFFEKLPYSFLYELRVIGYLKANPGDYIGALTSISDSVTMCLYAYSSLLFNRYLSTYSKLKGCTDERFPLLISNDPNDLKIYHEYLAEDGVKDVYQALKPLKFIYWTKRDWAARIFPKDIKYEIFADGAVIYFFLPKGAYATTFLANLFELVEGTPIPAWVSNQEIDVKKMLGQGSLEELKQIFKEYWQYKNTLIMKPDL